MDAVLRRLPLYGLCAVSYGVMMLTLFVYGRSMPNHVILLLYWLTFCTTALSYILFLLFEAGPLSLEFVRRVFWSDKRGPLTPFLAIGLVSTVNYLLVAVANKHIGSVEQIIASILQLPFVVVFNFKINGVKVLRLHSEDPDDNVGGQAIMLFFVGLSSMMGVILAAITSVRSSLGSLGWFFCYILSTISTPLMAVIFQGLFNPRRVYTQPDMEVYSKPILTVAMFNLWQLVFLTLLLWLVPVIDGDSVAGNFSSGLHCLFGQESGALELCDFMPLVFSGMLISVLLNFFTQIHVVQEEDATFAILVQQFGPIVAGILFSSPDIMGPYYDGESTTWRTYISLLFMLISLAAYRFQIKPTYAALSQEPVTLFEKIWIVERDDGLLATTSYGTEGHPADGVLSTNCE